MVWVGTVLVQDEGGGVVGVNNVIQGGQDEGDSSG